PDEPEVAVHLVLLLGDNGAHQLPRPVLGAPLALSLPAHPGQPPAAGGKKITRSASRGTSEKSRTTVAPRRPHPSVVGTAAHIPSSSWRRNSSISRSSSSRTSTSPSARTTSPCPGCIRRSFTDGASLRLCLRVWLVPGREREDVDRAGAGAEPAEAVGDGLGRDRLRGNGGVGDALAAREQRRDRRRVRA